MLAGALLSASESLLDRGIHPIRIADGFEKACAVAVAELDRTADTIEFDKDNTENLFKTAMTSLGSKMSVSFLFSSSSASRKMSLLMSPLSPYPQITVSPKRTPSLPK